jgi:ABC-type Fe3+/spermidine/putrescine transport system ATPase subunit
MTAFLEIRELSKSFGEHRVLDRVSLEVAAGEVLVLLGPSGSGKTTLLRLLAGFETPDRGSLRTGGREISGLPPSRRNFGMVFQHYALFPHLNVGDNVAFGLESRGAAGEGKAERIAEVLAMVDLEGFEQRRVHELSGGQQQRVALARALAPGPELLLLDEPLSNLDPSLRERTRTELRQALARVSMTAVWVTHEQDEAFAVGDRVALLEGGRLEQVGSPEELYLEPRTRFVAGFLGRASSLAGVVTEDGEVEFGDRRFAGHSACWPASAAGRLAPGTRVEAVFRPEGLRLVEPDEDENTLAGEVISRRYAGEATFYAVELAIGGRLLVAGAVDAARPGDRVAVAVRAAGPLPRLFAEVEA